MSKPTKQKRIKYETVYRVRWAAGNDADRFSKECAEDQVTQLAALGVEARVESFKRVKL